MHSGDRTALNGIGVLEISEWPKKTTSANTVNREANQSKLTGVGLVFQLLATVYAVIALVITLRSYFSTQQHPGFTWLFIVCSASFYIVVYNALSVEQAIKLWFYSHYPAFHGLSIVVAVVLAALPFGALHLVRLDTANPSPSMAVAAPSPFVSPIAVSPVYSRERPAEAVHPIRVLSDVQYQSGLSTTTVTIVVDENVEYEINRLTNPDRIYLDFRGSKIDGPLLKHGFQVTDPILRAIRIAEHKGNVSRVTLETNRFCDYLLTTIANSHKLQIELLNPAAGHSSSPPALPSLAADWVHRRPIS
jgi:hypothetical protein